MRLGQRVFLIEASTKYDLFHRSWFPSILVKFITILLCKTGFLSVQKSLEKLNELLLDTQLESPFYGYIFSNTQIKIAYSVFSETAWLWFLGIVCYTSESRNIAIESIVIEERKTKALSQLHELAP